MDKNDIITPVDYATVRSLTDGLGSFFRSEVLGLAGSGGAYLASAMLAARSETLLILTSGIRQAEQFAADLRFYHGRSEDILVFPHWEMRPYEGLSPHPEVEGARLSALAALHQGTARAVVLTVRALMQRVLPRSAFDTLCQRLVLEEEYERPALTQKLLSLGFQSVPLVEDRGSFSLRGDLLDIFPSNCEQPVRIEFFGDWIERMRPFDPVSQRSGEEQLRELLLLPAREMILSGEPLETLSRKFKERCDELEIPRNRREAVMEELREGLLAPGRQFFLPFNYPQLETFFTYAPKGRWFFLDPPEIEQEVDSFAAEIREGEKKAAEKQEPFAPADSLYLPPEELEESLGRYPRLDLAPLQIFRMEEDRQVFRFRAEGNADIRSSLRQEGKGMDELARRLLEWQNSGWRTLLICHQRGQAERLRDLLDPHGVQVSWDSSATPRNVAKGEIRLLLGDVAEGFRLPEERLAVVAEEEIFGHRVRRRTSGEARAKAILSSLAELKEGDFVVHIDYGIARYRGLLHLKTGSLEGDYLHLEYAGKDKLYLPVERIERVQKYVGSEGHAPRLDKMGGNAWEKAKVRARAAIEELAQDLLKVYARREMAQGFQYSGPDRMYRQFEAAFPYEETPDQLSAIEDVLGDMQSDRPMDRLVCGDVGYGKTEVAIRGAYKAVLDSKQVAVLVPTTVLARQHLETFRQRFAEYPVTVEMVSRFRTAAEVREILARAEQGKIDILIGTHRLLQRDVKFKDLGLVIVDEEQRFGVSHKEKLKRLRAEVDMLTLTATPIPRTLHMSLTGLRSLSVIDTPPVDRLAIRTYVTRFDEDLIREAILRELRRGGQVFFVHNRVQNIAAMAEFIQTLVPESKVAVGHGQMGEKELEEVMVGFIEGQTNVLVSSTIIENGLDIPRANTIIVNRADCFGLSQLYQLRGRVGRSDRRAYAYLLIPGEGTLTREARERLKVLQELTELGAGFRVASHDLELRGAGDLLGAKQSGQIAAIGFEMYTELLEEMIHELRGMEREEKIDPEVRLGLSAFLPEKYIPDPNQRLVLYKRLAAAEDGETLYALADEMRDRYGEIPDPASLLLESMGLRVLMKQLRVELAEYVGHQLAFAFHRQTPVPPERILALLEKPNRYAFSPDYRLSVKVGRLPGEEVLALAKKELQGFL